MVVFALALVACGTHSLTLIQRRAVLRAWTAPDGRRLTVEVERLSGSETTQERATIYFDGILDGDHWTARRSGHPGGRWFAGSAQLEQVDGPLLQVSGDDLLV